MAYVDKVRQNQIQQLQDARNQRSQGIQTGFDDEADNLQDDRSRYSQAKTMATPKTTQTRTGSTVINSSRPSDYAPGEKANLDRFKIQLDAMNQRYGIDATTGANLQNYQWQSQDRQFATKVNAANQRYGTDVNASVNREVGLANVGVTREVGLDSNRVTREVGLNRNQLQSGDNRFETTTKYGTQERMNQYNRNTLDRTEIAKEQIKAGTYGRSQEDINSMAIESNARKVNQDFNDRMMQYGRYQMEINKFNNDVRTAERSYMDQRSDLDNERRAATARYNQEQAQKRADLEYDRQQRKLDRDRAYAEFDIRRNDTNATLAQQNAFRQQELAFRQQEINNSSALDQARIAQIYADTKLKNDQFGAGRADISYNRNIQRSRSIAF
jgi:hypothetical protein